MQRGTVIQGIKSQEELYTCFPEPDPDYLVDEDEERVFHQPDSASEFPPPPPPCTADELSAAVAEAYDAHLQNGISPTSDGPAGVGGKQPPLVKPKPLHNPCVESKERQALHRELLMNYKIGKNVLKKPELDKAFRDRREIQRKKEWEEHKSSKGRTSLEIKLEERANRMKEEEEKKMKVIEEEAQAPELLRIHRKITHKSTSGEQAD
ncbi:protein FAM107B-like isoform X2 [Physella acuta]|uniref:protein FAM107B-like isoform X2 n=1 Tax=Physella acuta TaxID=109671 RepID=UPI0027DC3020|nr:protein FAM107B-like isoform X2 [Physella acuta]